MPCFLSNSFSPDVAGIALAGIGVWFVNYAIPMMAGSVIATKNRCKQGIFLVRF